MPEVVAQSNIGTCPYTSGGGFSTYYPTPLYQLTNVKNYLALVTNDAALRPVPGYNSAGRGHPDITMQGYYYVTLSGSQLWLSSGTSASSPAMAGIISTLNAARMRIGKGSLGFLHPALYKHASKFTNDVVGGNNKCTQNKNICCSQGFYATPGWDPASGLGSINYGKMEAVFLALGKEVNALKPTVPSSFPSQAPLALANKSAIPSPTPTSTPSTTRSKVPSVSPTSAPTMKSSSITTSSPSAKPSVVPSVSPTPGPTMKPSSVPTSKPSSKPSAVPSAPQTIIPTSVPSSSPSAKPSVVPSVSPTARPTMKLSTVPTLLSSATPSPPFGSVKAPFVSSKPSKKPAVKPSRRPTRRPSQFPTSVPTSILMDDDYWTNWLPTSQLTNAPSDTLSSGLHGNGQIGLLPTNSPTIKPSGSIRAIQVDEAYLRIFHTLYFLHLTLYFTFLLLLLSLEYQRSYSDTGNDTFFPKSFDEDNCCNTRGTGGIGRGALDKSEETIFAIGCKCDIYCSSI